MSLAWMMSALGLLAGAWIGVALVLRPLLVRQFIRVETVPDDWRCACGGALLAVHAAALLFLGLNVGYEDALFGALTAGAAAAVGAVWMGVAAGRAFALWRAERLRAWRACVFPVALALLIAAPWFVWLGLSLTA